MTENAEYRVLSLLFNVMKETSGSRNVAVLKRLAPLKMSRNIKREIPVCGLCPAWECFTPVENEA
jgi:hypothetical protein